ncbi:MAG: Endonuclease III [Alphaproteobacteria bacterium MarineAlpha3_Bin7]|nr:MAG: Endonuclease III [Alphaproteobacteria bacterium MarineAlpha3_Bin7]
MLKKDRVKFIITHLNKLYPNPPIPLQHKNNFELLVAVLLSAQCTDERVNKVTPELFALANNPFDMQKIPLNAIYDIIRPCGLAPKKSNAISQLSALLVKKYGGEVPASLESLEQLPGVGHKTASVVISQGYGKPAFPVDTHIHRLAQRWGLTKGKNVSMTEQNLKELFPEKSWNKLHLQMIFYGREYCTARGCDGRVCDICKRCFPNRKNPLVTNKP